MGTRKKQAPADETTPATPADPPLRLEWRSPQELAENPANWRRHPERQIQALAAAMADVNWAGACLYNETTQRLIDGHARRKLALDQGAAKIPVLVGRWTEEQEKKILATLDPLAALALPDLDALTLLLREVHTEDESLQAMLADVLADAQQQAIQPDEQYQPAPAGDESQLLAEKFQILIDCRDEAEQAQLLERLTAEGLSCRSLIV